MGIPKVGMVALLISRTGKDSKCIISNQLDLTAADILRLYRQRWDIEMFHKDIKQHLGFTEIFVRSRIGAQKHWTLIAIAYNTVMLRGRSSPHSFRHKIRAFRASIDRKKLLSLVKNCHPYH